jgi:hypothetical protein
LSHPEGHRRLLPISSLCSLSELVSQAASEVEPQTELHLTHLANVACEVAAKNFLRLLRNNASEAAEKSDDPALKARVLEQAIFGDIKAGRYDAAEAKIFRVEDSDMREALADYLWTTRAVGAAKQRRAHPHATLLHAWNLSMVLLMAVAFSCAVFRKRFPS